jgi:hypothetical protein
MKGKLPPFSAFFFFSMVFFFFVFFFSFFLLEKKKMLRRKHLKWKGKNRRLETKAKNEMAERELETKLPPFSTIFFFSMVFLFFCFSYAWEKKMLGENVWNGRAKIGAKSERAEWELKRKLPPFFTFFFFSYAWKKKDAKRKHLKRKGKSDRVEAGPKIERT